MKKAIDFLFKKDNYKELFRLLQQRDRSILIQDATEETGIMVAHALYNNRKKPVVVVAPNLYHAQIIYDKLGNAINNEDVLFFPQDEFITSELLVSSWEFRIERISTIRNLLTEKPKIIVTHLPGLLKPQLNPENWKNAIFSVITEQEFARDSLVQKLVMLGYTREYTVEKLGHFSVRGGIVDIYPLGESNPIRLDYFGDTIETIKTFDIETQRSLTSVKEKTILPMTEFFYSDADYEKLKNNINQRLKTGIYSQNAADRIMDDLHYLELHEDLDRLTRYIPFLTEDKHSILDYVPDAEVVFMNHRRVLEQYEIMKQELAEWLMETDDYAKMGFDFFLPLEKYQNRHTIHVEYFLDQESSGDLSVISLSANEPLSFEGNFGLLIREIKERYHNMTVLFAISSTRARDELSTYLENNGLDYHLLGEEDAIRENQINILVSNRYYDFFSERDKFMVITEDALEKRQTRKKQSHYVSIYEGSKRLASINDLTNGDYVVHYDYGIGKFLDIKTMQLGNTLNDYIHIEYRDGDKLYIPIESFDKLHKYAGSEGFVPRLSKLGGSDWQRTKQRVRNKAKDIADKLIDLYSKREKATGHVYLPNPALESDLELDFPYEETKDQLIAIKEVFSDMEQDKPMDRLICGDVGFGKTEVALRAAFRAILNNKQVAYLAPTTVLSKQHYQTFFERLGKFGANVVLLNRFVSKKQQHGILASLKAGTIDVLIGTHRILSKDIVFHDLGLLIIDEEQRFGVQHKERIKELKVNIDVLSLSATPIPRTLQMAIMGVKNMSLLESAPENRYPIQTYVLERNDTIIKDAIERELARKGQVFYLYNRIDDIEDIASRLRRLVPEARIEIAHGQMNKTDLEAVVDDFVNREIDVLLSTTIIETGIDIPNANTLIVHDADRLGLAQLYQIRGRVGRSNRIAYAYLMFKKNKTLTEEAEKRLKVIKEFTELGSGFKIAIRDLSIRGAGDILGSEQSGFIDSVGIDLYMKILEEEIMEKQGITKEKEIKPVVKATVSRYIDTEYIEDDFVKIEMHNKINTVESISDIKYLLEEFTDRFGRYDEELEIYAYERLFEKLSARIGTEKLLENKTNTTLVLSEAATMKVAGDQLFNTGMQISPFIRFAYRKGRIQIILDTVGLERHWLYTMVEFLEKVV